MHKVQCRRALVLATSAAVAAGIGFGVAPAAQAAGNGKVKIDNTLPRWLARATKNQVTPFAATPQTVRVYLSPNGGLDALKAKVSALSSPSSPDYGHWLTTAQFDATYAPTQSQVDKVSAHLKAAGLTVTGVEGHRRYVEASGNAGQLNAAFGVTLGSFKHDGQTVTAPDSAASLPADVAANVLTVTGLDTTTYKKTANHIGPDKRGASATNPNVTPPPGFANARPCSIWYGQIDATYQADYKTPLPPFQGQTLPYAPCGYTGPQFRAAYENNSTLDGSGVTVAITDAYAWQKIAQDANRYAVNHGDGAYAPGQLTQVLPDSYNRRGICDPSGWSGEETLDVEAVHAMAPGANIRYYASSSCFDDDFLVTLGKVVDENIASLVTNSWSDVEEAESAANIAAYEQVFLQGATQGQTFLFSSGDNGDELARTGIKQVDYPASDPYVTAAGGTSTGIDQAGNISMQTGWGTVKYTLSADGKSWTPVGFLYGSGGGFSALFNRPSYQDGVVTQPYRGVPDISMDGDPNTGMLIGQTQTFPDGVRYGEYRIGGTSLSSPLLAGFWSLRIQKTGERLGWLNPKLYNRFADSIIDVRPVKDLGVVRVDFVNGVDGADGLVYSVRTFDQDSTLKTTRGWDQVTGLGVPAPSLVKTPSAP
jgi:subtilase family serine protease